MKPKPLAKKRKGKKGTKSNQLQRKGEAILLIPKQRAANRMRRRGKGKIHPNPKKFFVSQRWH